MERKLKKRKKPLTPKQKKLCQNFVRLGDEERAYFAAGYKGNGNHKAYMRALFEKDEIIDHIKQIKERNQTDLSDLNFKYQLFIKDYLIHFNASKAYFANVSPLKGASLYVAASQLLNTDQIQEALKREMTTRCEKLDIEGDRLVQMLINIADNDPDGLLKNFNELPRPNGEIPKPLKTFKIIKNWSGELVDGCNLLTGTTEVEEYKDVAISDRNKAIELLMRYKGMLIERHNIKGSIDHNVKAGVLLAPGMLSIGDFDEQAKKVNVYQQKLLEENNGSDG